ncbi:hypothetical protein TRIP_D300045 [uncultured Paludibacter sp.]|nr:hypothetical protein TRIP_D300045 [uncultured Paludibacter sp.]
MFILRYLFAVINQIIKIKKQHLPLQMLLLEKILIPEKN